MMSNFGQPLTRTDGRIKVTGKACFAGDHSLSGQLHGVLVTATIPAGRVKAIDSRAALATPRVVRLLMPGDLPKPDPALEKVTVPPLATRLVPMQGYEVVHEGQPIAMVLAESIEAAEAGAAMVKVEYDRAAFVDAETAAVEPVDKGKGGYSMASALEFHKGDADRAIISAPVKAEARYTQPSRHANPMEPSAILAVWENDRLTVYDAVQHLLPYKARSRRSSVSRPTTSG
jgi:xanthine dehydrogenase YagR molybdenum-binding subunit